jgi:hypothetical protein
MAKPVDIRLAWDAVMELERMRWNLRANAQAYILEAQLTVPLRPLASLIADVKGDANQFSKRLARVYNVYADISRRTALVTGLAAFGIAGSDLVADYNEMKTAVDAVVAATITTAADVATQANNVLTTVPAHDAILDRAL